MISASAYALLSTTLWMDPVDVGEFCVVIFTAIINTKYKTHKRMCQARKYLQENFNNVQKVLKTMFECIIDPS